METAVHNEHYNGLGLSLHNGVPVGSGMFADYSLGPHSLPPRELDERPDHPRHGERANAPSSERHESRHESRLDRGQGSSNNNSNHENGSSSSSSSNGRSPGGGSGSNTSGGNNNNHHHSHNHTHHHHSGSGSAGSGSGSSGNGNGGGSIPGAAAAAGGGGGNSTGAGNNNNNNSNNASGGTGGSGGSSNSSNNSSSSNNNNNNSSNSGSGSSGGPTQRVSSSSKRGSTDSAGGSRGKRPGRKCGTHLRFADIDAAMLQWMLDMNAYKVPLSDSTIQAKAKQLAQVLGTNDFKASSGWLYKFKERHGFVMSSKAAQSSMGPPSSGPQHSSPTGGHNSLPQHASLNPHAPHSAHLAAHSHGPHGAATGPPHSPMGLAGLSSPSMNSQHSLSSHSPPGHPLASLAPPSMANPCLPGEYTPVSTNSISHTGHPSHHAVMSQQRGPLPSLHQPPLSSLGHPSSGHLSTGQLGGGELGGQMPPPAVPPPSGHPHTPRVDRLTPPPPPLPPPQPPPSLASLGMGQMQMISPGVGVVNQSVMPVLPAPPQQVSPPPPVATPAKPSPDYELANYHRALFDYDPQRIYTVSETCLLYNKLPTAERDTLSDTLNADARITVLLCSNASGTHKLRPLVINCRRDGEDFNEGRGKLPVSYASQRSSFLTGNIFQQWIWELERRVEYPCVLLLDTSPAHVSVQSDKIKLLFLQNSLRQLQPLNQGAVTEFKARYKAEMISHAEQQEQKIAREQGNQGSSNGALAALPAADALVPFLDALYILNEAWNSLARETLLESWTKSQLLPVRIYSGRRDIEEEAIHELSQSIKASRLCCAQGDRGGSDRSGASGGSGGSAAASPADGMEPNRREVEEYLHLDDTFPTSYSFSEEAFESSSATQGYSSEAMDAALMQYYHLRRSRQLTPDEILAMLDKMEQFFTHQALISSTDMLAIQSLRSKTYKIASNYYPPTASAVAATPAVVTPPALTSGAHLSAQYNAPLLAGTPLLPPPVPVPHQQSPFPSTPY